MDAWISLGRGNRRDLLSRLGMSGDRNLRGGVGIGRRGEVREMIKEVLWDQLSLHLKVFRISVNLVLKIGRLTVVNLDFTMDLIN